MLRPHRLHRFDGEAAEEFLLSLKVTFKGRNEQRLSEASRTVQEDKRAVGVRHPIDISRLVDIEFVFLPYALKRLQA